MRKSETLPTIREIPDDLWERIEPVILDLDPPKAKGRKRVNQRKMLEGVIFRMRSGCQWNHLPRELGDDSVIHRTFQRWVEGGVLEGIWAVPRSQPGAGSDRRMRRVGRGKLGMAVRRLLHGRSALWGGAIGRNPTDRGKAGSKKSILVDAAGGPLSVVVAGANVHDTKLLRPTLESIVVDRPEGAQNLCLDKGYDNPTGHGTVADAGYQPHIRRIGEEKLDQSGEKTHPARRWVVERTLGWLSKCRAILVRYDKKPSNYLGLLQLACALIWYRRQWSLANLR